MKKNQTKFYFNLHCPTLIIDYSKSSSFLFLSSLLIPSFPAIYSALVWHMAATNLHASVMLDAIVLKGGSERE